MIAERGLPRGLGFVVGGSGGTGAISLDSLQSVNYASPITQTANAPN